MGGRISGEVEIQLNTVKGIYSSCKITREFDNWKKLRNTESVPFWFGGVPNSQG